MFNFLLKLLIRLLPYFLEIFSSSFLDFILFLHFSFPLISSYLILSLPISSLFFSSHFFFSFHLSVFFSLLISFFSPSLLPFFLYSFIYSGHYQLACLTLISGDLSQSPMGSDKEPADDQAEAEKEGTARKL